MSNYSPRAPFRSPVKSSSIRVDFRSLSRVKDFEFVSLESRDGLKLSLDYCQLKSLGWESKRILFPWYEINDTGYLLGTCPISTSMHYQRSGRESTRRCKRRGSAYICWECFRTTKHRW